MTDLREQLQESLGDAYAIERELGGGGMSRVFVATERALGRKVVVKVIPIDGGEAASQRFRREITTAAQLQHPHIVPVLSAGDAGGVPYFTMPYVDGDSLRARLAGQPSLPITESVKILRDVAQALAFAHARGFVHRDIKPDNILLADGAAVVTDFGVAKALSSATGTASGIMDGMTAAGVSLGTPAYMAPEQVSADPAIDHRADIYAWGCVAYELLTGAPLFGARTPAKLFVAHLTEEPAPIASARTEVSPVLAALVMRCLEKDPAHRPQSARELLGALDSLSTPQASGAMSPASRSSPDSGARSTWRSPQARVALAATLLLVVAAGAFALRSRQTAARQNSLATPQNASATDTAVSSLAVLPFVNTSGNAQDEYFSDGMTDELAHALSKLPGLRLAGRSSSFAYKGKSVPAPDIGRTLGVGAIIEGTVRRSGERLRVTAQLTSTRDGRVMWSDAFERAGTDVFEVQDEFTGAIVGALRPLVSGESLTASATASDVRGTSDSRAYDLYLRGRYYWAQRGAGPLDTAVSLFEQAVQIDPRFARGWAGLALAHVMRPNTNALVPALPSFRKADDAARKSLALDSTLSDAYSVLGMTQLRQWKLAGAGDAFATARRFEPANATARHWSALYFGVIGDTAQADREIGIALSLDPLSATTVNSRASMYSDRRRFREALDDYARSSSISSAFGRLGNAARALLWSGQADSALKVARASMQVRSNRGRVGGLLIAAAAAGELDEAQRAQAMIQRGGDPSIVVLDQAIAELVLGDRARAARLFVQSLETEGTIANAIVSLCDPLLDPVRNEPAYVAFIKRHGVRDCPYRSAWPIK